MNWINIDEDLPSNGSKVCVKLSNNKSIVCTYKNDSFGLGDLDFQVLKWMPFMQLDLRRLNYNLRSTLQVEDHINDYSAIQLQILA